MVDSHKNKEAWTLSPSYDIGVGYTFRNLLKDNPYRRRFFRQWISRFDHENIKNYYNYETGASRNKGSLAATEVNYDQVQRMVYDAGLPIAVENELFYHLDYHLNRENKSISFLKLKEFFAFCGIDGIYDLENKKHSLCAYDPPFVVNSLNVEKWEASEFEQNRELVARMMSEPGEVPNNKKTIEEIELQYNLLWAEAFSKTGIHKKLDAVLQVVFEGGGDSLVNTKEALEIAKAKGADADAFDDEIAIFSDEFDKTGDAKIMRDEISMLKADEAEKLAIAMAKHADPDFLKSPTRFAEYDKDLASHGLDWDYKMNYEMNDIKKWGRLYIGHESHQTCSNEPLAPEEIARMKPNMLKMASKGFNSKARFSLMMADFEMDIWPQIRDRYCAIQDWILRDYTMNEINKGEIAKARREDIPVHFRDALRAELNDGLLTSLQFPIRAERLNDGSGNCMFVLNDEKVEVFNPRDVLPELSEDAPVGARIIQEAQNSEQDLEYYREAGQSFDDEDMVDFKLHSPSFDTSPSEDRSKSNDDARNPYDIPLSADRDNRNNFSAGSGQGYNNNFKSSSSSGDRDRPQTPRNNMRRDHQFDRRHAGRSGGVGMQRPPNLLKNPHRSEESNRLMRDPIQLPKGPNPLMPRQGGQGFPMIPIPFPSFGFGKKSRAEAAMENAQKNLAAENMAGKPASKSTLEGIRDAARGAKADIENIDSEGMLKKSKRHLANLSAQAGKTLGDLKDSLLNGTLVTELYKDCVKALEDLQKQVMEVAKMLINLLTGGNSPSRA